MKEIYMVITVFLVACATQAHANPPTKTVSKAQTKHADNVIFACTTNQNKQILVTETNHRYRYQFGKPAHPELVFENDKTAAIARSPLWTGIGRSIWSNLVLQNGNYFYTVYTSTDRLTDEHHSEEGVTVSKATNNNYDDADYVSHLVCNPKQAIVVNLPAEVSS